MLTALRSAITRAEGWWFDTRRGVQTEGYFAVFHVRYTASGETGHDYLPTRPSMVRRVLRRLPVQNLSEYTFVDLGSGKGRVLLVAAEYPFAKIRGVEFSPELHQQAEQNIARYRHAGRRCSDVQSIYGDAMEYEFPDSKLILYLYNPFDAQMVRKVFTKLEESVARRPRHVVVVLVNLQSASVADSMPFLRLYDGAKRYRIYQTSSS